jgi:hypothetical protein
VVGKGTTDYQLNSESNNNMKDIYEYNEETLSYDKVVVPKIEKRIPGWKFTYLQLITFIITVTIGFCIGILVTKQSVTFINKKNVAFNNEFMSKHDLVIGSNKWRDSVFTEYAMKANLYLSRDVFEGTPIKGEMLALAAENAYDSTGILLPVELCLAQCQWESGMGLEGKSPTNNPFNVGEYDSGTVMWFDNTFEGTQAYFYFMTTKYLKCKTIGELFESFVNCSGHRYASGKYEEHVPEQYYFIVDWFEENLVKPV